jgi:Cytochrome C oxidase, cbb3-type, subunit III
MKTRAAGLHLWTLLFASSFFSTVEGQQSGKSAPPQSSKPESVYAEIGKAPERARARRNPLEKDPEAVAAGRILFGQRCAECHGDSAEGGKKGPSLRAVQIQNAEPGAIFWILTNGVVRKEMPCGRSCQSHSAGSLSASSSRWELHKRRQRRPGSVAALSVGQFAFPLLVDA